MKFDIRIDDREVQLAFNRLIQAGEDLSPAMRAIGEHMVNTTRERFRDEKAPDGTPWAPLSEVTLKRKKRNVDKILTERGYLSGTIAYREGPDFVEIGSSRIYASTHQFGAAKGEFGGVRTSLPGRSFFQPIPWGDIPARPFLGVSDEDSAAIADAVLDHIDQAFST